MTESETRAAIEKAGGTWEAFGEWMYGQTMGLNPDGSSDFYEEDVSRFIAKGCRGNASILD